MNTKRAARLFTALALLAAALCLAQAFSSLKRPPDEPMLFSEKNILSAQKVQDTVDEARKISINTADKQSLISLNGIGKHTAEEIIKNRPYYYLEDVMLVKGIGEKRFSQIRDFISLE